MIKSRDLQWFHRCLEHSLKGKPGGQYRMSAVFTYKNIRVGPYLNNYTKTDPLSLGESFQRKKPLIYRDKFYSSLKSEFLLTIHAELRVIKEVLKLKIPISYIRKGTLYIGGVSPSGAILTSRPCSRCEQLINKVGIRRIVYSTHRGQELILEERFI